MLKFFNDNFGRHLVEQGDDPVANARRALSSGHRMKKGGMPQRIASGWAVIRPGNSRPCSSNWPPTASSTAS